MVNESCGICLEPITNPVCSGCYLREVYSWMQGMKIKKIPKEIIIELIKRKLNSDTTNEIRCVLCNKEEVSVCSYCFFSVAERILKELNLSEELINNYNEIFNYHL